MALYDWYCDDVFSGKLEVERIWEDDRVLAFHHPHPSASPHVVIVPKDHVPGLLDPLAVDGELLVSMFTALQHSAREVGFDATGEGFYLRASCAAPGVTPHMHWHLLPGAGSNWPALT